jgi:HD-like signal output (HDOD) protein
VLRHPAVHVGASTHSACATLEAPRPSLPHAAPLPAGAAHRSPALLTHDQTITRLHEAITSNTAAGVIAQVLALASSPLSEMAELVRVIECDPALAARVLQIANSAAFATSKPTVTTIDEAARNIGFNGIYNIASSFGLFNAFPPDAADGFNLLRCWQHSLAVAEILPMIRGETPEQPRGTLHLIGLCHDLGEILLRQHFAVEYAKILNFAVRHRVPVRKVEAAALSLPHHELISLALGQMMLPAAIIRPIAEFFETPHVLRDGSPVARSLALANDLAHALQLAPSVHARVQPITHAEWRSVAGAFVVPPAIDAALRARVVATTSVLAGLNAQQDVTLRQPLLARKAKQIRYVRHKMFCDPDPLAVALDGLAHVTVSDRVPESAVEWQIDALVVVSPRVGVAPVHLSEVRQACAEAARPDLPVLCIVADDSLEEAPAGVTLARYPIEVAELGKFVASIA